MSSGSSVSSMRILVVTQYFWPEMFRINDLVAELSQRGHAVTVLTGIPNYPGGRFYSGYGLFSRSRETYCGARIIRVPLTPRGRSSALRLALNYLSYAVSASLFGPVLARQSFDVVFAFQMSPVTIGIPAIVMKRLRRAPLVFWVQDLWPESLSATGMITSPRMLGAVGRLVRSIYRRCDRILIQSPAFRSHVLRLAPEAAGKIEYVPNWAEHFYRPVAVEADAAERRELPDGFRVMFAGNIGTAQSFETILEAASLTRHQPGIHWIVIGDGHRRDWVEKERMRLALSGTVHLIGARPPEAMPRYLALADALLVTLRDDPAFDLTIPSKVQSYLACGRPVVAALNGEGRRTIEQSGAGLAVRAGDAHALAEAVLAMAAMQPDQLVRMARRAREYYEENFERDRVVSRIEELMSAVSRSAQ